MKVPVVKVYQSSKQDMTHYIFRTQDANIEKSIEEFANNQTPVGVVQEYQDSFNFEALSNKSMTIDANPKEYSGFTAFSMPFEFNIPNTNYRIEFKNNVEATGIVSYTIYLGFNVISKVDETINGVTNTITDYTYINENFKITASNNALLVNSSLVNYKLANFYGTIKTFGFIDDGTCGYIDCVPSRAHGVYTPKITTVEATDYISFYQAADTRRNIYYYNVISKTHAGMVSEMSNTQVCEISEDPSKMQFVLESSDDYFQTITPVWTPIGTAAPIEEIKVTKTDLVSNIIPVDNFMIYANDDNLKLENIRELKITNIWNSTNRNLMNRDKKAFRAINKFPGVDSGYSDIITFDDQLEILIDKIVIIKKNVSGLTSAEQIVPLEFDTVGSEVIKVFVRQGGLFYKDFFLNEFGTNKVDEYYDYDGEFNIVEIPDYLVSSITLDSRFPLLSIKDGCIYGNKYNYTIYLYDEFGKTSKPISVVL